jgi:phospholipase A-2-activating protein
VRAVLSSSPLKVFSASRDSSAIVWTRTSDNSPFLPSTVYKPSSGYVGALTYLPPTEEAPEGGVNSKYCLHHRTIENNTIGYLVTGSQDGIIGVYVLGSGSEDPKYMLLGHQHNVCALHSSPDGTVISGSWDK